MMSLKDVLTLTQWDFAKAVRSHEFIAVFFFNTGCALSWKFASQYEEAARLLSSENHKVNLALVDVSIELNKYLAICYSNWRYPTVKIFRDRGQIIEDYLGPRDSSGIVDCFKRISCPIPAEINNLQQVNDLDKIVIVGLFPDFSGDEYDKFVKAAEKLKWEYDIYKHLSDVGPVVRVFNLFVDKAQVVETKDFNVNLVDFVNDANPRVVTLHTEHRPMFIDNFFYNQTKNDKAVLLIKRKGVDTRAFESKYHQVAKKYRLLGINFMLGDLQDSKKALSFLGFPASKVPSTPIIVIRNPSGGKYAKFNVSSDYDFDGWLRDYKLGRVTEYGKSEPIPKENDEIIEVVVADSFDDKVMKSGKNVLLAVYRSTCEQLAHTLNDVANEIDKAVFNVAFAKLDETTNDIRSQFPGDLKTLEGAPTLYFITVRGKIKLYKNLIDKDCILQFVKHQCTKRPPLTEDMV